MYVTVEPLHDGTVWFTTSSGGALGVWRGQEPAPEDGSGVHVELTVPVLRWGVDAEPAPDRQPGFARNEIVADVEQVDDDGVVTMRVETSIFLAEFAGAPPLHPGQRLVLRPSVVELYPTGY